MSQYIKHIFVCDNVRVGQGKGCCGPKGGLDIQKAMKKKILSLGLSSRDRANRAGCLNFCQNGVTLVIYPQGIWYGQVTLEDVDEIIEKSIIHDEIIDRLLIKSAKKDEKRGI